MLLDIGAGIILGIFLGPTHSTDINVLLGILFCLLPDADLFFYIGFRKLVNTHTNKRFRDHRELFHYPLIYIVLGCVILGLLKADLIALFAAGSLVQFLHDTIGAGWGIPWFFPFSRKYFKLFYQLDMYHAGAPQRLVWIWTKSDMNKLEDRYGDEEWAKHVPQLIKVGPIWWSIELGVFVIGIIILLIHG